METIAQRDYEEKAQQRLKAFDALEDLVRNPESVDIGLDVAAEKEKAELDLQRADLLNRLSAMTGYPFAVYDGAEMPGAAGFVLTNGEKTIYIAEHVLDDPNFADHVAKHEAYHLNTMLVLPVAPDFGEEHFKTLDNYLPETFKNNTFYLEGFNEWLTANNDEQGVEVTAYGPNVKAAQHLEALAVSATGESLMSKFKAGDYHGFAETLKITTDRLMLHEALQRAEVTESEKLSLRLNIKAHKDPINSSEKADLAVDNWVSAVKASKIKKALLSGDSELLASLVKEVKEPHPQLLVA